MIITQKALSRRTVLRGLGATVALPFLDSMVPALSTVARAQDVSPRRFTVMYVAHGYSPGYWLPETEGPDYELTMALQPLEKFRDRMLLLSGIDNEVALQRPEDPRGGHGRMVPGFMCGVHAKPTQGVDFEAGISIDQIAADHIGQDTVLPSLQLTLEAIEFAGTCDSGYSCAYTNTLSWRTPTLPLPMQDNPRAVFERLFGDSGSTDPAVRAKRRLERRSILDSVLAKTRTLSATLGTGDRRRFDQYLQSIREVEQRMDRAEAQSARELPMVEQPMSAPDTFPEYARLMIDLMVLAYQADLTRVSAFMLAKEISGRAFPEIGVSEGFHSVSHHGNNPATMAQLAKINVHMTSMLAYFLEKMEASPEGDGSLLDHGVVLYGSNHGDPNKHEPRELPILVFGGDHIKGGRHIRYHDRAQLPNLHVTLLNSVGVPVEHVGVSTEKLSIEPLSL